MTDDRAMERRDSDDITSNPSRTPPFDAVLQHHLSRRAALQAGGAALASTVLVAPTAVFATAPTAGASSLTFVELAHGNTPTEAVAPGYQAQTLIRWGDPVVPGAPAFDPLNQTVAAQEQQFGYNNDYIGYLPLPAGSTTADHGLLCVNHEYTDTHLMFPGVDPANLDGTVTQAMTEVEIAAHGHSVLEIKRDTTGKWHVVPDSRYNRRLSAWSTPMKVTGPAAGHDRMKTSADPTGTLVIGTLNNCAGGKTPWGTVLIAEENFHQYFGGDPSKGPEATNHQRLGIRNEPAYPWHRYHARFHVEKEPNEPNRFGWMVEFDPYDPTSIPLKRTALGRFKHEGATVVVNKDGRVVAYSGDDQQFEYVYRFVSDGRFDPNNPAANAALLDHGTLSVARFEADGTVRWLPLVVGTGPLTSANGFHSQADVVIETRRAADLLGATPMDRPEDVEPNPVTGVVYVVLTNNVKRKQEQTDKANPRAKNEHGHIIEMIPPGTGPEGQAAAADHAADTFTWSLFLLAGNPAKAADGARYHPQTTENGWLSCPDNLAFDGRGRMWIATDGAPKFGIADGVYGTDTGGPGRALTRHFYRTPLGAELCGPEFNTDDTAYFAAVQHPGDVKGSTFAQPATRWPDFQDGMPPRPSVQVVTKDDGGPIGA